MGGLAVLLFGASALPEPYSWVANFVVLSLFLYAVVFLFDVMVPGVNLLSRAWVRIPSKRNVVFTFDDGPSIPYTKEVLDVLDRYSVKGTFFCIGENVRAHPETAKEIVRRGHLIANHTESHRPLPWLSRKEIEKEIRKGMEAIEQATGVKTPWLRCPKGYKSAKVARVAGKMGVKLIGFSYPLFDVQNPPPQELLGRLLEKARGGDIILMHDGFLSRSPGQRDSVVKALPPMIEGIRAKGLEIIRLDEALEVMSQRDEVASPNPQCLTK